MKKLWIAIVLFGMALLSSTASVAEGDIAISTQNFPDKLFRAFVEANYDKDNNGYLSESEIIEVDEMSISYETMETSAKGLEYFTALKELYISVMSLQTLNVSANTKLERLSITTEGHESGSLTSLIIGHQPSLKELYLDSSKVDSLDISGCPALEKLWFYYNTALDVLDLSSNLALKELRCDGNGLTELDVSLNTQLISLDCENNALTSIDVSNNVLLESIYCDYNSLTVLDVSMCPKLESLSCRYNNLLTLDIIGCSQLSSLDCEGNRLASLNISDCPWLRLCVKEGDVYSREGYLEYNYWDESMPGALSISHDSNVKIITEGVWTWNLSSDGVLTISGTGPMTDYREGFDAPWYSSRANIHTVVVKPGINRISNYAFYWCSGLTEVSIPDSVTSIGKAAFNFCQSLTTVTIPNSVISIADGSFENSPNVVIYCCVDSAAHAFSVSNNIPFVLVDNEPSFTFVLPVSMAIIEPEAFMGIAAESIMLPTGAKSIDSKAFANCLNLRAIYIPPTVMSIATDAFTGVTGLTVYGEKGSKAENYAIDKGFQFVEYGMRKLQAESTTCTEF